MTVRSLDLLDIPLILRYRQDVVSLDSSHNLTCGNPLGGRGMLDYLDPRIQMYTAISADGPVSVMGRVVRRSGYSFARLSFLAPGAKLGESEMPLLDHLAIRGGEWGAFHLLAELDEGSPVFKSLRSAGFSMYAWQRIWRLNNSAESSGKVNWQTASPDEMLTVQSLYSQIVPALFQPVEEMPRRLNGLTCHAGGSFNAFAALRYGPEGIWIQPLVHPDADCAVECLKTLAGAIPDRGGRPVYLCVRSYQAWLESALESMGAEAGVREAVMVKRLVSLQRETQTHPAVEKSFVKPAARATHVKTEKGPLRIPVKEGED